MGTHLHRMGRCGRISSSTSTNSSGRGIIFYNDNEIDLVNIIKNAELNQEKYILEKNVSDEFFLNDVVDSDSNTNTDDSGKVTKAFSRRRGFRKKIKKKELRNKEEL